MKFVVLLICIATAVVSEGVEIEDADDLRAGETGGGPKYWRIRAITKSAGFEWAVTKLGFYESRLATGNADKGEPIVSSTKKDKGEKPVDFSAKNAFDGQLKTMWKAGSKEKDEWIGVKYAAAKDIKSIKIKVHDYVNAPSGFVVEKSEDGNSWARVVEVTDCLDWSRKEEVFAWKPMDVLPSSVFAIRNQNNPRYCVGAKPTPIPDDPKATPIPIKAGTALTVQYCDDNVVPQWWSFDTKRGLLHSSANHRFIVHVNSTAAAKAGDAYSVGECVNGCADNKADEHMYSDTIKGGFLRLKAEGKGNLVMSPKGNKLAPGNPVVVGTCGADGKKEANIDLCKANKLSQWELLPMFSLEKGKQAINCSPYSHSLEKPKTATTQQQAQRLCARDNTCSAYNWVDGTADGDVKDMVYLCKEIHDVHSGVQGWELGIRSGRAEDPYEAKRTHTIVKTLEQSEEDEAKKVKVREQ